MATHTVTFACHLQTQSNHTNVRNCYQGLTEDTNMNLIQALNEISATQRENTQNWGENQQYGWTRSMEEDSTRNLWFGQKKNNQIKMLRIKSTGTNNKRGEHHQQTWSAEEKKNHIESQSQENTASKYKYQWRKKVRMTSVPELKNMNKKVSPGN